MKKSLQIASNPITLDNLKHRANNILIGLPEILAKEKRKEPHEITPKLLNDKKEKIFNELIPEIITNHLKLFAHNYNPRIYKSDGSYTFATEPATYYQNKSLAIFDLTLALNALKLIHHHIDINKISVDMKYNNKTVIWLQKYVSRRFENKRLGIAYFQYVDSNILNVIRHWLSIMANDDYKEMRTINWQKGTWENLFKKFEEIYPKIQAKIDKVKRAELLQKQSPHEVLFSLKDGWKWVKIEECGRDEVEASLMGHCGVPEWQDSYLISLRDKYGVPHVTATLKELKPSQFFIIGQIKGKGNRKPDEKYEPQIFELFNHPGFFMQFSKENQDWHLTDFNDELQNKLIANKPWFKNLDKISDKDLQGIALGLVDNIEYDGKVYWVKDKRSDYIASDLVAEKNEWILKSLNDYVDVDVFITHDDQSTFVDDLMSTKKNKYKIEKIFKEYYKLWPKLKDAVKSKEINSIHQIVKYISSRDDEFDRQLDSCIKSGWEIGSYDNFLHEFNNLVKGTAQDDLQFFAAEFKDEIIYPDTVVKFYLTKNDIIRLIKFLLEDEWEVPVDIHNILDESIRDLEDEQRTVRGIEYDYSSEGAINYFNDSAYDELIYHLKDKDKIKKLDED